MRVDVLSKASDSVIKGVLQTVWLVDETYLTLLFEYFLKLMFWYKQSTR